MASQALKTNRIIVEQTALEPWAGQVDIIDAALINHVSMRLMRRARQKIVMHSGDPCVWVDYATVGRENWMIDLPGRTLKRRFAKLVALGLLVRTHQIVFKDNGSFGGTRTYFGIGRAYKARLEQMDQAAASVKSKRTEGPPMAPDSYEGPPEAPPYEGPPMAPESLGGSPGTRVQRPGGRRRSFEEAVTREVGSEYLRDLLRSLKTAKEPGGQDE